MIFVVVAFVFGGILLYSGVTGLSVPEVIWGEKPEASKGILQDPSAYTGTAQGPGSQSVPFFGTGAVTGDTSGLIPDMQTFLQQVAAIVGRPINVVSGRRPGDVGSNHQRGAAADIGVGGDIRGGGGDETLGNAICSAGLQVCGVPKASADQMAAQGMNFSRNQNWRGHSVEFGWKTLVGGNHYNHVHMGFDT